MTKSKPSMRPSKKGASKRAAPETADEFQEAADHEEETGGKWRAGDPAKSSRAFLRALDIYNKALERHPANFDLAYNKARLQFEIAQQPSLVENIGLPLTELLKQTLDSHRFALKLKDDNPDILFNTSQVLTSLAEQLSADGDSDSAILQLQEALELLSTCLSRQEMLLEQQQMDFEDADDGGVQVDADERPASPDGSQTMEQTAVIEIPVSAGDLLDTVHATLSALTTLAPLVDQMALQTLGDMAESLTEKRALHYITMLPADMQESAKVTLLLDRAIFVAAFADAQYNANLIELQTYIDRLDVCFDVPRKLQNAYALSTEGEARVEVVLSTLDRYEEAVGGASQACWSQLTLAQDLYTKATKLETEEAKERKAAVYKLKGDAELLRSRLALLPSSNLDAAIQRSAPTLVNNAATFYKGAAQLAKNDDEDELEVVSKQRWLIATYSATVLFNAEPKAYPFDTKPGSEEGDLITAVAISVDEGLVSTQLGEQIIRRIGQS